MRNLILDKTEEGKAVIKEEDFILNQYVSFDLEPYSRLVEFKPGEVILKEGERPEVLYYLEEGRAKLSITHGNGTVSLINFITGPCFIGEMELIGAQESANAITAVTGCRCYAVSVGYCRNALLNDVKFLKHLCLYLGRKAAANTSNYTRNQSYPLENRLASFLLLSSHNGIYLEKHTEAAEFLGVTYRHLLYVLADFKKRGIVEKAGNGYRIMDEDQIKRLAAY